MTAVFERDREARPEEGSGLSADELAGLREQLQTELRAQVNQANEQTRAVAELKDEPREALGQLEVVRDLADVMVVWSREATEDIEAALARLDEGTYGICEQCAGPIRVERLKAIPHARYCVSCQGRRDAMR